VAIDRDADAVATARAALADLGERISFVHGDFRHLADILADLGIEKVDGVLMDLGPSAYQLETAERGFSYQADGPLDMRMDRRIPTTAADLVNGLDQRELERIIRDYGEERWASRIAGFIVQARARRPLETTGQLVEVIKAAIPAAARRQGPHPARRTFQALRIAVNDELGALEAGLQAAIAALLPGGRVCVISFHSLEDRLVKQTFLAYGRGEPDPRQAEAGNGGERPRLRILTRKPVRPSDAEVLHNPRARSARLRAAERTG